MKRGLRPKGGGGFSLYGKLFVIEEKKPSDTASPCHLPFQGRLYTAGPTPPCLVKCRTAAKGIWIKPFPYDMIGMERIMMRHFQECIPVWALHEALLPCSNHLNKPQFTGICVGAHHDAPFSEMHPYTGAS